MKKTISIFALMILVFAIGANAAKIQLKCGNPNTGIIESGEVTCPTGFTPKIFITFLISDVAAGDNMDSVAASVSFDGGKLTYSNAGKWPLGDFMESNGASTFISAFADPSGNVDTINSIIGADTLKTPVGQGYAGYYDFTCTSGQLIKCGAEGDIEIVDTGDTSTSDTWWQDTDEVKTLFEEAAGCTTHADCDDGVSCTVDTCDTGSGECSNTPNNGLCDDSNGCTDDTCDSVSGCQNIPNANPCDDGNACTTDDTCSAGTCVGGAPPDCNDGNVCTTDSCNPATGCINQDNTNPCDDANACTTDDTCSAGTCIGGAPPNCDDSNICTDDSCNSLTGCINQDNTNPCDDNDVCTTSDQCSGGACVGGAPLTCDDSNTCTDDSCNPLTGCAYTNSQPGTLCGSVRDCPDDACNGFFAEFYPIDGQDTCDGSGNCDVYSCAMEINYCTDDDNTDGINTLECGAGCDQNDDCAQGYECDLDSCQCVESQCFGQQDGTPCDNGLHCDGDDECQIDVCVNTGPAVVCDDQVSCTDDSCNEGTKSCDYTPNDNLCSADTVCADYYCDADLDCQVDYEPDTTICRAQDGDCDVVETCTGSSPGCPADDLEPDTTECRAAINDCDVAENCDGINNDCPTDDKALAGTECGLERDCPDNACNGFFAEFYPIDGHDTCDGSGNCDVYSCAIEDSYCTDNNPADGFNTLECDAPCDQDGDCDDDDSTTIDICTNDCACIHIMEICDNGIDDEGDSLIDCEDPDCDGQNGLGGVVCCQSDNTCNYLNDGCADGFCTDNECEQQLKPAATECRASAGECDITESCTGSDPDCPADTKSTAECRASAGDCDVAEVCDGIDNDCPADVYKPAETDCGICAECDGTGSCTYDSTQDDDCASCPEDGCGIADNDGVIDDYYDYPISECEAVNTCTGCEPDVSKADQECLTERIISIEKNVSIFSLPLVPVQDVAFQDIESQCTLTRPDGIAYYNPTAEEYTYIYADTILYPGQGYFTTQADECDITVQGYEFTADHIGYLNTNDIKSGWNLIGAPSEPINDFDTVEGDCTVTSGPWGFDAENYQYERTQTLEPGKGYFIMATNDCGLG